MRTTVQVWCAACGEWECWGLAPISTQTAGEVTAYMLVASGHVWSREHPFGIGASVSAGRGRYTVEHYG